jgi:hypothetical protein
VDHYWSSGDTGVTHQKAREVGKSFGEAVWGGFPTCELLVMHGGPFDIVNLKDKDAEAKARAKFDLHPSFLVGLLEALDKNGGKGELHLLLESSYDGTLGGQFYDDKVKEVYAGIKAKANELKADKAAAQWKKGNCTIALGAWPLGAFADKLNGPNKVNYSADSFGTQLDAFKAQMTCLGAKPDSPGPPKYVWVYGEANAWLETKAEVRAPYTKKITERWPGKVTAPK